MLCVIAFSFCAGATFSMLLLMVFRLQADYLEVAEDLFSLALSLALAIRVYSVAMSKARRQSSPSLD
jgi:hypothetical protein